MSTTTSGLSTWQVMSSVFKPEINPSPADIDKINSFFFCRYLSNNKFTLPIANTLNIHYNLPVDQQYRFARVYSELTGMPGKVKFISFSKDKTHPMMEKVLSNIERRWNVNRTQALQYFEVMTDEQKDEMFEYYDYEQS